MKRERNEPALMARCDSVEVKAIMDAGFMKNPVQSSPKKSFYRGDSIGNINPTPIKAMVGLTGFLSHRVKKDLNNFGIKILFRFSAEVFHNFLPRPCGPVWPIGRKRIPDINDGEDPGRQGNFFTL
jgi:hypothetical protein